MGLKSGPGQCTPDSLPADILRTHIVNENEEREARLHFERGPVLCKPYPLVRMNQPREREDAGGLPRGLCRRVPSLAGGETMEACRNVLCHGDSRPMENGRT